MSDNQNQNGVDNSKNTDGESPNQGYTEKTPSNHSASPDIEIINHDNTSISSSHGTEDPKNHIQGPLTGEEMEVLFMEELDEKYLCIACSRVLQNPVQLEKCGHRCCSECLETWLMTNTVCHLDQVPVERDRIFDDKAFQRQISSLAVRCSWFPVTQCLWTGVLRELAGHLAACPHRLLLCTQGCHLQVEARLEQLHLQDECVKRTLVCQFCEKSIVADAEKAHLENRCPLFPIPCPNSCKKNTLPRKEMDDHLNNHCSRQKNACQFAAFGCEFVGNRKKLNAHNQESVTAHLLLLNTNLMNKRNSLSGEIYNVEVHKKIVQEFSARLTALEHVHGAQLIWRIEKYADMLNDAKSGRKTTLASPTFLTSKNGYRLGLSVCLYGDGKARGQYMSLFVCVCRGENDALLKWPFNHRITLSLLDQCDNTEERRPISYVLKPNICPDNLPFLGRPMSERNASFGNQKFCDLATINTLDYIRDDTIFFRAMVDFEHLPMI